MTKVNRVGTPEQRFWKYVNKNGENDCWGWTGANSIKYGYGRLHVKGKKLSTHRFSYELHFGNIPKGEGYHGICVLHSCDNPICVNPKHLFLGTQQDNIKDMHKKNRGNFNFMKKPNAINYKT